jgi:hypothetical protein
VRFIDLFSGKGNEDTGAGKGENVVGVIEVDGVLVSLVLFVVSVFSVGKGVGTGAIFSSLYLYFKYIKYIKYPIIKNIIIPHTKIKKLKLYIFIKIFI